MPSRSARVVDLEEQFRWHILEAQSNRAHPIQLIPIHRLGVIASIMHPLMHVWTILSEFLSLTLCSQ